VEPSTSSSVLGTLTRGRVFCGLPPVRSGGGAWVELVGTPGWVKVADESGRSAVEPLDHDHDHSKAEERAIERLLPLPFDADTEGAIVRKDKIFMSVYVPAFGPGQAEIVPGRSVADRQSMWRAQSVWSHGVWAGWAPEKKAMSAIEEGDKIQVVIGGKLVTTAANTGADDDDENDDGEGSPSRPSLGRRTSFDRLPEDALADALNAENRPSFSQRNSFNNKKNVKFSDGDLNGSGSDGDSSDGDDGSPDKVGGRDSSPGSPRTKLQRKRDEHKDQYWTVLNGLL